MESALLGRQLPEHDVRVVGQGVGQDVARLETLGAQRMDELVSPARQLAEGQRETGGGRHDGRDFGVVLGDVPESQPLVPGVLHRE